MEENVQSPLRERKSNAFMEEEGKLRGKVGSSK